MKMPGVVHAALSGDSNRLCVGSGRPGGGCGWLSLHLGRSAGRGSALGLIK